MKLYCELCKYRIEELIIINLESTQISVCPRCWCKLQYYFLQINEKGHIAPIYKVSAYPTNKPKFILIKDNNYANI